MGTNWNWRHVFTALLGVGLLTGAVAVATLGQPGTTNQSCAMVNWTNATGGTGTITTALGEATKSGGNGTWEAGANTTNQIIAGQGGITETVSTTATAHFIGLVTPADETTASYTDMDFALEVQSPGGQIFEYEKGVFAGTLGTAVAGDTIGIQVNADGHVSYLQNGVVGHTTTGTDTATYPLEGDLSMRDNGSIATNVMMCGVTIPQVADPALAHATWPTLWGLTGTYSFAATSELPTLATAGHTTVNWTDIYPNAGCGGTCWTDANVQAAFTHTSDCSGCTGTMPGYINKWIWVNAVLQGCTQWYGASAQANCDPTDTTTRKTTAANQGGMSGAGCTSCTLEQTIEYTATTYLNNASGGTESHPPTDQHILAWDLLDDQYGPNGKMQATVEALKRIIQAAPTPWGTGARPTVCGFGGSYVGWSWNAGDTAYQPGGPNVLTSTSKFDNAAANFSPDGCDTVYFYPYGEVNVSGAGCDTGNPDCADYFMKVMLPYMLTKIKSVGTARDVTWNSNTLIWGGLVQSFGLTTYSVGQFVVPTYLDEITQANSYCSQGANNILEYSYDDGFAGYTEPHNDVRSPGLAQSSTDYIAWCKPYWAAAESTTSGTHLGTIAAQGGTDQLSFQAGASGTMKWGLCADTPTNTLTDRWDVQLIDVTDGGVVVQDQAAAQNCQYGSWLVKGGSSYALKATATTSTANSSYAAAWEISGAAVTWSIGTGIAGTGLAQGSTAYQTIPELAGGTITARVCARNGDSATTDIVDSSLTKQSGTTGDTASYNCQVATYATATANTEYRIAEGITTAPAATQWLGSVVAG